MITIRGTPNFEFQIPSPKAKKTLWDSRHITLPKLPFTFNTIVTMFDNNSTEYTTI